MLREDRTQSEGAPCITLLTGMIGSVHMACHTLGKNMETLSVSSLPLHPSFGFSSLLGSFFPFFDDDGTSAMYMVDNQAN